MVWESRPSPKESRPKANSRGRVRTERPTVKDFFWVARSRFRIVGVIQAQSTRFRNREEAAGYARSGATAAHYRSTTLNLAAIDVGTNSIHLVVVELDADFATSRLVHKARAMVRLGSDDALERGRLGARAMVRGVDAIERFVVQARDRGATQIRAVATSAVREAENAEDFVRAVAERVGITLEVLSERDEARYIYLGVSRGYPIRDRVAAIVDIGGGSTEFIVADGYHPYLLESVRLGSLRLYDAFFRDGGRDAERALVAHVDAVLDPLLPRLREFRFDLGIGTSGTIMGLGNVDAAAVGRGTDRVHGYPLRLDRLRTLQRQFLSTDEEGRRKFPGMNPRRADIIVAGNALLIRILERLELDEIIVCERALRDGVVAEMAARDEAAAVSGDPVHRQRVASVEAMARHYDAASVHQRTATSIALQLFRMLADLHKLPMTDAELLYAAASLHDIGRYVGDSGYHKYSAYLIRNGRLPGWQESEIDTIALVARYYRKAMPKSNHPEYMALGNDARRRVNALASILRIACGLDTRHLGIISSVAVERPPDRVVIVAQADQDVSGELEAAAKASDLFERTFGIPITFVATTVRELV